MKDNKLFYWFYHFTCGLVLFDKSEIYTRLCGSDILTFLACSAY